MVVLNMNRNAPLDGSLYIKFDKAKAGNKQKNCKLADSRLKDCVPNKAKDMTFPLGINGN